MSINFNNTDEVIKFTKSIRCYFNKQNIPDNTNLVCYYCLEKCISNNIKRFADRRVNNIQIFDVPLCPNCKIDSLISYEQIPSETDSGKIEMLSLIKRIMFY